MAYEDYKVPKLNGENYHAWSIRARAALVQKKCWDAVEPGYGIEMTENERKKNDEALTLMFLIVDDTFLDDIGDCSRAREAWNSLKEMHTKFGLLHVLQLMKDFFNTSMKPGETVKSYLGRLMDIHRKLSSGGYAFTDREVALIMLIGLPKSYESLIINLEKDEENLTTAVVKSKLLIEEKRISRNEYADVEKHEERALHTKSFNSMQKKPVHEKNKKWASKKQEEAESYQRKTKCFSCGEWGHISRHCEEAKQKSQSAAKTVIDLKNWALSVNLKNENKSRLWILDSGATEHMTSDKAKYVNFKHYKSTVEVANSEKIEVTGIGDLKLLLHDENEVSRTVTLENVLYVPKLGGNLLSVGRIEERGLKVEFANGEAKVTEKNDETVFIAKRKGRLYVVEEQQPTAYVARTASEELWHRRLGHPSYNALKGLNEDICHGEELIPKQENLCSVCIQGKMNKLKFPKTDHIRSQDVLDVIHSDVVGRITPSSLGGSNYFVTFTDEYSHYTCLYPMKTKDEVLDKFDEYRRMAETFHGKKIKALKSDNGGEYKSERFDNYLIKFGIKRQLSVPESPQQNGLAERLNQTLANITRCFLIESGANLNFWAEAACTAAYVLNKRPSTAIKGNTPERLWSNKEPNLKNLKVFGSRVWSHVRSYEKRSKFDPKAKECVFVGYPDGIKGYKLWDLKNRKFFISRDVVFEENIFPFKSKLPDTNENFVRLHIENEEILEDCTMEPEVQESCTNSEQIFDTNNSNEAVESCHIKDLDALCLDECNEESAIQNTDEKVIEDDKIDPGSETTTEEPNISPGYRQASGMIRARRPPQYLDDYILYNVKEMKKQDKDPISVTEALSSDEAKMWKEAMTEEFDNLLSNQTWELVPKPVNTKPIGCKWVFKRKLNSEGEVIKFKARLVAKGYSQVPGRDFSDTFSPVVKIKSIRILLALAMELDLKIHQMDITAAYLNGTLKEDIYMLQPEGMQQQGKEHLVCHLKKTLYGLKQAGREWNECFDTFLKEFGLCRSKSDPCIYYHPKKTLYLGLYVDDMLIVGTSEAISVFKLKVMQKFQAKDLGEASEILSMRIQKQADGSLTLDQTAYIEEILETFGASSVKGASTPLDPSIKHHKVTDAEWSNIKEKSSEIPYRQAIGSLLYVACGTRPDIAFSSTYMSQFNERPSEQHWRSIKHLFRYLKETKNLSLTFRKTGRAVEIFSDADWGADHVDRKSFSGYVIIFGGAAVSWSSKKQCCTALSSAESEYLALAHTTKEVLWLKSLMQELGVEKFIHTPVSVKIDSQAAMFIAKNQTTSERSKHIDIRHHFLRDYIEQNVICLEHVASVNNVADLLTKNISKKTLIDLRKHLGFEY